MRFDWLPLSASALVAGGTAFAVAVLMTPSLESTTPLDVVAENDQTWLAVAGLYFLAGAALIGGMPAVLTLMDGRRPRLAMVATTVFTIGALGTIGYASLLVFLRALVEQDTLRVRNLEQVTDDSGIIAFVVVWVGGFYIGQLLIGIALMLSKAVPRWVGLLLIGYLAVAPIEPLLPEALARLDVLLVAVGFAAVGIEANNRHLATSRS